MQVCTLCPRRCGVNRAEKAGACGERAVLRVARAALHPWEEPCISGTTGSGTLFFSGCPLGCVYCQNGAISRGGAGRAVTPAQLGEAMLRLQDDGAHNINLVTPMHFTPLVLQGLEGVRNRLHIPIIVNTGGYESAETIARWAGLCDIWMPDFKYKSTELSVRYSAAPDYFDRAAAAILAMHRQQPTVELDSTGLIRRGLMVRHLVLPSGRQDSAEIVRWLAENLPRDGFLLSLMGQFTPNEGCASFPELQRTVTTFEYQSVLTVAQALGLQGYGQSRTAAAQGYVPEFE